MNIVEPKMSNGDRALSPEEIASKKAKAAAAMRRSRSCIVALQPRGKKRPLFCIHPHAGVVFPYYELALLLGEERPLYALQSIGIAKNERPLTSIEDMATRYIEAMQAIQPEGPYILGGWSFGGIVAFEMARQLQMAGETMAMLISIDTTANGDNKFINGWHIFRFTFKSAIRNIWPYVFDYLNLSLPGKGTKKAGDIHPSPETSRSSQIARAIAAKAERGEFRQATIRRLLPVLWGNTIALTKYKPQFYPGEIVLLRSQGPVGNPRRDPTLGWKKLTQNVQIHEVPGKHLTVLRQPHVTDLAEKLKACLEDL